MVLNDVPQRFSWKKTPLSTKIRYPLIFGAIAFGTIYYSLNVMKYSGAAIRERSVELEAKAIDPNAQKKLDAAFKEMNSK